MIVTYNNGGSEQPDVSIERVDLGATAIVKYGGDVQPDTTVAEAGTSEKPKMLQDFKEKMKQLRIASGETHGEAEMPVTCAPLIFPALDAAAIASQRNSEGSGSNIGQVKERVEIRQRLLRSPSAGILRMFLGNQPPPHLTSHLLTFPTHLLPKAYLLWKYLTKPPQAYNNPESTLTAQAAPTAPKFRSRFADPNNATNTHFFTLITGGKFKAEP